MAAFEVANAPGASCGYIVTELAQTPSEGTPSMARVNEAHFAEIEKTLLCISTARQRAERALRAISKDDGEPHLVEALEEAERELDEIQRRLMQSTYFAVPKRQLSLERDAPISV